MQEFHGSFQSFWGTVCRADASPILEMEIADLGADEGIDVAIYADQPSRLVFDTVLVDPESDQLLKQGSIETEAFWRCIRRHITDRNIRQLFVTLRCSSSLIATAISSRRMGYAEMRNVRFLRMAEDILDELTTREPCLGVDVIVTYRNTGNGRCINGVY